jgi:Sulfotransferase family
VRDYRANLVSHRRVFTVKKGTDIVYRWMKVNMLIEDAKRLSPEKYFTLTYESLVSNPEQKMEEVCRFLNLPYDKNMVQNHQSGMYSNFNRNKNEGFLKVHQNVFNPINSKHITEWEEKLSADELASVEAVAGEYGEARYGYRMKALRKSKPKGFLLMDLKYRAIKALYRNALSNPWLYWGIKKYLWRSF